MYACCLWNRFFVSIIYLKQFVFALFNIKIKRLIWIAKAAFQNLSKMLQQRTNEMEAPFQFLFRHGISVSAILFTREYKSWSITSADRGYQAETALLLQTPLPCCDFLGVRGGVNEERLFPRKYFNTRRFRRILHWISKYFLVSGLFRTAFS